MTKQKYLEIFIAENGPIPPNVIASKCDCGLPGCPGWILEIKEKKGGGTLRARAGADHEKSSHGNGIPAVKSDEKS